MLQHNPQPFYRLSPIRPSNQGNQRASGYALKNGYEQETKH